MREWKVAGLRSAGLWVVLCGCSQLVGYTDQDVARAIAARQRQVLDYSAPVPPGPDSPSEPAESAYRYDPSPSTTEIPPDFDAAQPRDEARAAVQPPASEPSAAVSQPTTTPAASAPASRPRKFQERTLTLTQAFAYAQRYRREYQTAREDLYLAALALTLERHLWTPQFAADLRHVYGNFGELTDFDQAMRFMADLSVTQRLPYGGEFAARAVSTLIRDIGIGVTASEGSQAVLELTVPFLRGAGHVAREDLIQLERDLTYAVRDFERFRRRQLVDVASAYFGLLRNKQSVIDAGQSVERAESDFERARALEQAAPSEDIGSPLDTRRAQQRLLSEQARAEQLRESFRVATDRFKLLIGMPVDERVGLDDLESIEDIERQTERGAYPLLRRPPAALDEPRALLVGTQRRLDLLNRRDQIEDAKRGVAVARNALLPNLDWNGSLTFDTDPQHLKLGAFEVARAAWRSELILSMNDRFREKNQYRASLIDVRRAQRAYTDLSEQVRVEVRQAVNQIRLQERVLQIQRENVNVAAFRAEYSRTLFREGDLGNRDLVEAEDELIRALNDLNEAKTASWSAVLDFRLATETLRIDENGVQSPDAAVDE